MRTQNLILAIVLGLSAVSRAADPPEKVVSETWDAAYLNGAKAGHVHTLVKEITRGDQLVRRAEREMRLNIRRFGQLVQIRVDDFTEESRDGKVLSVGRKMAQGQNQMLEISGVAKEGQLHVSVNQPNGGAFNRILPWRDDVVGLVGEENLLKEKKAKPGDSLSYRLFEPTVNNVILVQVKVNRFEEVPVNGKVIKLLRAESVPEKIADIQLPPTTIWMDEQFRFVRSQGELPGLGRLLLVRGTKAVALAPTGNVPDMENLSIVLNRPITDRHARSEIRYRVTLSGDDSDPAGTFASDVRQSVQNVNVADKSFELIVKAFRAPDSKDVSLPAAKEFLESNYFLNSDDARVRQLAKLAAGNESDPWKKALRIEKWVNRNMKAVTFSEAMATSDEVARTLQGDCTEFAMLTAGMCKAEGIPARTAIGLIYYEDRGVPKMGYHMWTEVFAGGNWVGLDATLGLGGVGSAHLKISDHSWYNMRTLAPMLPLMRVMVARPKIEVLQVK
jgi:transglutaminase-like putative cysteine protease